MVMVVNSVKRKDIQALSCLTYRMPLERLTGARNNTLFLESEIPFKIKLMLSMF
jgi:hypothetical protein